MANETNQGLRPSSGATEEDWNRFCDQFHPTDSVYIDPIYGAYRGQDQIRNWLVPTMLIAGDALFIEYIGDRVVSGGQAYQEWVFGVELPDGTRPHKMPGCSVQRSRDGWIVYQADYFDTHMIKQQAQEAGISLEEFLRSMAESAGRSFPGLGGPRPGFDEVVALVEGA